MEAAARISSSSGTCPNRDGFHLAKRITNRAITDPASIANNKALDHTLASLVLSWEIKYVLAEGNPAQPNCTASATVTLRTASEPTPVVPNHLATITLVPSAPANINTRVTSVNATL